MKWEGLNEDDHDQSNIRLPERGVLEAQERLVVAKLDYWPKPAVLLLHEYNPGLTCRREFTVGYSVTIESMTIDMKRIQEVKIFGFFLWCFTYGCRPNRQLEHDEWFEVRQ